MKRGVRWCWGRLRRALRAFWRISDMSCIYGYTTAIFSRALHPEELKVDGYHIQLISPSAVAHPCQILWGLYHALRELERGEARAHRAEVEALLWITGSWQISEALEKGGMREDERAAFLLFFSHDCRSGDVDLQHPCKPQPPPPEVLAAIKRAGGELGVVSPGGVEAFRRLTGRDVEEENLLKEVLHWVTLKGGKNL